MSVINTLATSSEEMSHQVDIEESTLAVGMDEEEFVTFVEVRRANVKKYQGEIKLRPRQKVNKRYYLGDQVNKDDLRDDAEFGVDNAIFRNMETFVPIATARVPELMATPKYKNEETKEYAGDIKSKLQVEWEDIHNMKYRMGQLIRRHNMDFLGVGMFGRDEKGIWFEIIPGDKIEISKDGSFVYRTIDNEKLKDVVAKFPDKKTEIFAALGYKAGSEPSKKILDSEVVYGEVWTDELVGWIFQERVVLGIEQNPHFDYEGSMVEVPTGNMLPNPMNPMQMMPEYEEVEVKYNHFDSPRMPFVFLSNWNLGEHVHDDTTLIEQAIGLQDWINKRKRQIGLNADSTNGHWVTSADYMNQDEFAKIQGTIDEKIFLKKGIPKDGIMKVYGGSLPPDVYNDLNDSRNSLDNVMGTHATTRGEKSGVQTATQEVSQKQSDYGRVDGYVRDGVERFAKDWFEYYYHLCLLYSDEEDSIAIPDEDDMDNDNVNFSKETIPIIRKKSGEFIPVPLVFRVQEGSTLPHNEVVEYEMAFKVRDQLSPIDFFKKIGFSNPKELYKNFLISQHNPYQFFEGDEDIQKLIQSMAPPPDPMAAAMGGGGMPSDMPLDAGVPMAEPSGTSPEGVKNALMAQFREMKQGGQSLTPPVQ